MQKKRTLQLLVACTAWAVAGHLGSAMEPKHQIADEAARISKEDCVKECMDTYITACNAEGDKEHCKLMASFTAKECGTKCGLGTNYLGNLMVNKRIQDYVESKIGKIKGEWPSTFYLTGK